MVTTMGPDHLSIAREGEFSTLGAGFTSTPPEEDMEGEV